MSEKRSLAAELYKVVNAHGHFLAILPMDGAAQHFVHIGLKEPKYDKAALNNELDEIKIECKKYGNPHIYPFRKEDGHLILGRIIVGDVVLCLYPSFMTAQYYADNFRTNPPVSIAEENIL